MSAASLHGRPWPALRARPLPRVRPGSATGATGVGVVLLAGYALLAVAAPWVAPYDPSGFVGRPLEPPSARHWLGTNDVGQDILSELIWGARASLAVATLAATTSLAAAAVIGTLAGYRRGWTDALLMRVVDGVLAVPHLPLMILLAVYLPPSATSTALVIALLAWPIPARVIRAQTLAVGGRGYIAAARLFGGPTPYVIGRHLLPALGPILAATFIALAGRAVMLEAGLAFLGLGDPLAKSWGLVMRAALDYQGIFFTAQWTWWLLPAGLNVTLLILGFTLVGMGLEQRLDPRLRRRGE